VDPCIIDYSVEVPTRCSFVIEFIIPKFLKAQHVSGGTLLKTCWIFKKLWNNKFYYKAASCWYFYWVQWSPFLNPSIVCWDLWQTNWHWVSFSSTTSAPYLSIIVGDTGCCISVGHSLALQPELGNCSKILNSRRVIITWGVYDVCAFSGAHDPQNVIKHHLC
jgi:hypothetical protein